MVSKVTSDNWRYRMGAEWQRKERERHGIEDDNVLMRLDGSGPDYSDPVVPGTVVGLGRSMERIVRAWKANELEIDYRVSRGDRAEIVAAFEVLAGEILVKVEGD